MRPRTRPAALAAALALATATTTAAAQPRSAIPWLSDSVELSIPALPPPRPKPAAGPGAGAITVTPLDPVSRDAVGLLKPDASGLPRRLWGGATADEVRALLIEHPDAGPPAARALFRRLLLAEADPPAGAGPGSEVLLTRLDRLLELGALDEAEGLILAAGPETPELFRRWFDVGLLTQRAQPQCEALRLNPALSPTLPARVFCLARGGDWNAAEITLTLGQGVGAISPEQEALLARFLDPQLFEEDPEPPLPRPLTALDFTLREAVGLSRPPGQLPLAFLWTDLTEHTPMRMRVEAAERLVLAGSAGPDALLDAYRSGAPAASGGIWDRAAAAQALDAALAAGAPEKIADALAAADAALSARGLRVALATAYAPALAALDPASLPEPARGKVVEILLLGGESGAAARVAGPAPDPRTAALLAIAGVGAPPPSLPDDPRLAAALAGLADRPPADERETRLAAEVADGAAGTAIVEALALAAPGPAIDPASLTAALFALRAAGQTDSARAIALQALLLPGES
ncbi:hypothetical protein [Amaricoccus sp.]|uniref:hypothetical protein n=1 Tax=Amaricoccus sp. TaxID=1872485 RepID=UPI001B65506A|nr:hypothetical protein [Amaricoccus sp.]MBP7002622.1 hypothetical protein [Amaricoccus sp.]